jgi:predicted aldo/keto reductase-like oxidoreductase
MSEKDKNLSRRDFIKAAGVTGLSSVFALSSTMGVPLMAQEKEAAKAPATPGKITVPTRVYGKTGAKVAILSLGGIFDITTNQIILKKALDWGVTYWDTADCYHNGNSEIGIGKYFEKFPEARKSVFLVTKSDKRDQAGMTELLNRSLERMKTDYIDLYFIHGLKNPDELSDEVKAWAEKAKKENKIKHFGFSTHRNMAEQLLHASKLGWIDGIMMTYNYDLLKDDKMQAAVDACHKAGIGLTAMKTQRGGAVKTDTDADIELGGKFLEKGFTPQQAKIKAIWQDERISAICSQMPNLAILQANVAAAVDKTKLEVSDLQSLDTYAEKTRSAYCAGCAEKCEAAIDEECPIADIMRYVMYYKYYGEPERARAHFAELPASVKATMAKIDFTPAEKACPRNIAIGSVIKEALQILT